jgi:hypothetical protein
MSASIGAANRFRRSRVAWLLPLAFLLPTSASADGFVDWLREKLGLANDPVTIEQCASSCQLNLDRRWLECDGFADVEELRRQGKPMPTPTCRNDRFAEFRECRSQCGVPVVESPRRRRPTQMPSGANP